MGDVDRSPKPDFPYPKNISVTTMTQYNVKYPFSVAFPPQKMNDVLAEYLAKKGVHQCHVAETEKYAHVTFFFNGGVEKQFDNEQRDMISSPRVATYDLEPKMSAMGVADKMVERIKEGKWEFIMNNFAPPDMVSRRPTRRSKRSTISARRADTFCSLRLIMGESTSLPHLTVTNAR
jgi:2,3-bisphosphoglycerate-independent phosphoglycerate mutase